jgi:HPt (histidine-containing phosphotransfer) domain-containing protein
MIDIAQAESLLDISYLEIEIETLGVKTLFELLELFRSDLGFAFLELDDAARQGNWDTLRKRVHRLRGAAGNVGMTQVIEQARQLELIVAETGVDFTMVVGLLESLENICHSSCDALHRTLSAIDNRSRI